MVRSAPAFALGAVTAFYFDPDRGRARRARLKTQSAARMRRTTRRLQSTLRYEENKFAGRMRARTAPHMPPEDDATIVQKVRSEVMGREPFRELDVLVDCFGGVVHLRGEVADPILVRDLVDTVKGVEGVVRVDNLLHRPGQPAPNKADAVTHR
jgi:hypothetical protein